MTREGQVTQLTHFADYFKWTYINQFSRSPDGRFVAFQLEDSTDINQGQLMLLNIEARSLVNYCIPGSGEHPPVRSPDSRYLVVANLNQHYKGPVYIIDRIGDWAAQIAQDIVPEAWWNAP